MINPNRQALPAAQAFTWVGTDITLMARIQGKDVNQNLVNLQQTDITSIAYTVYDSATGQSVNTGTLTVASVIFNTLQTGTIWVETPLIGFNFLATLSAATNFPSASKTYFVDLAFTLSAGGVFQVVFANVTRGFVA